MAGDDWRIRIEFEEEEGRDFLHRIGLDVSSRAKKLAEELERDELNVSHDADTVFVYAGSENEAERAREVVTAELEDAGLSPRELRVERWLHDTEEWV
ncbi:MAG TPA: hypothetical protein VFR32_07780 [Gaiellaceae bacterium]|nr:hypothetical protein [Gaiellaceae bacterium]